MYTRLYPLVVTVFLLALAEFELDALALALFLLAELPLDEFPLDVLFPNRLSHIEFDELSLT